MDVVVNKISNILQEREDELEVNCQTRVLYERNEVENLDENNKQLLTTFLFDVIYAHMGYINIVDKYEQYKYP